MADKYATIVHVFTRNVSNFPNEVTIQFEIVFRS